MTPILCKYKCGVMLDGWDDEAHKYKEATTGGIHTKERCQEAKAKKEARGRGDTLPYDAAYDKEKDDHGNENVFPAYTTESFTSIPIAGEKPIVSPPRFNVEKLPFVDHTAKGTPQFKVFSNTSADILTIEGNEWIKTHKDQYQVKLIGQLQFDNGTFAITLYYEETK
jgi:hypothetical protein